MADIAFLLLTYFLMTTTMDQNYGLRRQLPPPVTGEVENQQINERNIIIVRINSLDKLFAGGQAMDVSMLKDKIKEFLLNPTDDPKLPEKKMTYIEGLGREYPVSNGVISLQNDRSTTYRAYITQATITSPSAVFFFLCFITCILHTLNNCSALQT